MCHPGQQIRNIVWYECPLGLIWAPIAPDLPNVDPNPHPIVATLFNVGQMSALIVPTLFNVGRMLIAIVPTLFNCGPNLHPIMPTLLNVGPHPPSDSERYAEIVPTSTIVPTFIPFFPIPPLHNVNFAFCCVQIHLLIVKGTPR